MPSGRTHDRVTMWSSPIIAGATLSLTHRADLAFWVSGGFLVSGLIFGPDLDLYSFHYKRWGKLRWLWRPYQKAINHRSIWSHGPIVGTIGRILYLGIWVGFFGIFYIGFVQLVWGGAYTGKQLIEIFSNSLDRDRSVYISLFCGLELGAMSHYMSDLLVSKFKRSPLINKLQNKPTAPRTPKAVEPGKAIAPRKNSRAK